MADTKINMTLLKKDKISWHSVSPLSITFLLADNDITMTPAQVKRLRRVCDETLARAEALAKIQASDKAWVEDD